jgi:hypothetical protein
MGFRKTGEKIQRPVDVQERFCDVCKRPILEKELPRVDLIFMWSDFPYEGFLPARFDICSAHCLIEFAEKWKIKKDSEDWPHV